MQLSTAWTLLGLVASVVACDASSEIAEEARGGSAGIGGGGSGSGDGGVGGEAPATCEGMLSEAQVCLTDEIWNASGVAGLAEEQTDDMAECIVCHADGTGGFMVNNDPTRMFDFFKNSSSYLMLRFVSCTVDARGAAVGLRANNNVVDKGIISATCPDEQGITCHPGYSLSQNVQDAIATFAASLVDRWSSSVCQ